MISLSTKQVLTGTALSIFMTGLPLSPVWARSHQNLSEPVVQQSSAELKLSQADSRSQPTQTQPAQRVAGIVQSFKGETLVLRLADGTCQTFTVTSEVLGNRPLRKGNLVVVNTDTSQGIITQLETPATEETIDGVVTAIVEDQVTLQLPSGETEGTTIAPETIARLGLKPGVPIRVTTYEGIPVTRVCLGERPRPPAPVIAPPPAPEPPPPVRALW